MCVGSGGRAALAALLGVAIAWGGVELWLGWWLYRLPGPGIPPFLGTLRGASYMDGLWDPTLAFDAELGWTLAEGAHPPPDPAWGLPATIGPRANRVTGADDRPDAAYRVAAFGDSFVFGFGVRDDEAFIAVLARTLGPDWQVTNHGVSGYGDDQVALAMDRWLPVLDPDVVIVGHTPDDTWRNGVAWSYSAKRASRLVDGAWVVDPGPLGDRATERARWMRRPLVRHVPALLVEAWTDPGQAAQAALATAIVHAQLDRIEAAGAVPVLIDVAILGAEIHDDGVVDAVCAARPVRCVDALPVQRAVYEAGLPVFSNSHYSAVTSARLGALLAEAVRAAVSAPPPATRPR